MWHKKSLRSEPAKSKARALMTPETVSGVLEIPTDTVLGWGVWLDDERGIRELMRLKNRGLKDKKVFSLVVSLEDLMTDNYVLFNETSLELLQQYLEEPLTLVLPRSPFFVHWYYGQYDEVGVRMASTETLRELAEQSPFLLTSANPRGGEPEQLGGAPTTVVRVKKDGQIEILRQGDVRL